MQYLQQPFWFSLILLLLFAPQLVYSDKLNRKYLSNVASTITVSQSGQADFRTIQSAIDSIPSGNRQWIEIKISPGIYQEKVLIPKGKPFIFLNGTDPRSTIVQWGDHEATDTSATFTSFPDNILAKYITFKNTYGGVQNGVDAIDVKPALAARIVGDKSAFYHCTFIGLQDTLWDAQGRHYFYECYISGAIDFIFGNGQSIYERCFLEVTYEKYIPGYKAGFITAQGRESPDQPTGFVFKNIRIVGATGKAYLGRAYRAYSRVIFYESDLSDKIVPAGWDVWNQGGHENDIVYAEANCSGSSADTSGRVPWLKKLNPDELNKFVSLSFIDQEGWISRLPSSLS